MAQEDLKQKAASGMVWASIQKFAGMGISFVSGIILARLLTPQDYGCIGMLAIFMQVADSFVDGGFGSALIQKKRPTQEDYSTVFYFSLGISLLIYLLFFIFAPSIARFYKMPLLSPVLRVQGLVLIINAFSLVQANQLRKQLRFKKISIVSLIAAIISLSVTILMAYNGYGVWSLVVMNLLTALIPAMLYWLTNKWYPLLVFSIKSFKELFGFGFYILLSNFLNKFCNNIQGLLIGRLYNASVMGYFSKAKSTEDMASTSIASIMDQVTYPLYAEFQNDKNRLGGVIKKITGTVAYITFPMMFLLILLAEPIFILLYSDRWVQSIPYFQVFCLAGIAICLQGVNYHAVAAIGMSKIMFKWTIIKRLIGLILVLVGLALMGLKGILVGMVMTSWLIYLINAYLVDKYIGYKLLSQLWDLTPILLLTLLAFVLAFFLKFIFSSYNMYLLALMKFILFLAIFIAGSKLLNLESYRYFMGNIPLIIKKFNKKS